MGKVYRARDSKLKRDVAIKVLLSEFDGHAERLARFHREAEVLAVLNHPHIGSIYDLENYDGLQFLVLELVEGETLEGRIARGPIPAEEALSIAAQIAEAITKVPIQFAAGGTPEPGLEVPLFTTHVGGSEQQLELAQYAVSPDGNRFLMNAVTQAAHLSPITLVLNWKPH